MLLQPASRSTFANGNMVQVKNTTKAKNDLAVEKRATNDDAAYDTLRRSPSPSTSTSPSSSPTSGETRVRRKRQKVETRDNINLNPREKVPIDWEPAHEEDAQISVVVVTWMQYLLLAVVGHIYDFFERVGRRCSRVIAYLASPLIARKVSDRDDNLTFESFFSRHVYLRLSDSFNRIIASEPGGYVDVLERYRVSPTDKGAKELAEASSSLRQKDTLFCRGDFMYTGRAQTCINLASYNYLGYAESTGPRIAAVKEAVERHGLAYSASFSEAGACDMLADLERSVAGFLGVDDAICISMGFNTNSATLPALVDKGCLILSDELNHASLVFGARLSGASIRVFQHNSPASLEAQLRAAIAEGQPRTRRPWRKILVVTEGLFSMEGTMCPLPALIALKKRYGFYLYVDEAHSVGAVGPRGRGVCDYFNVDPRQVDVLMGTFTKSFGGSGGYVAGSRDLIAHLRTRCHAAIYAESLPVPVLAQVLCALNDLSNDASRVQRLLANTRYFRDRLRREGYIVYGDKDSPVVPMLVYMPAKLLAFSRMCLARGLAVVVVGAPATPIVSSRARFCLTAAHTIAELDRALDVIVSVARDLGIPRSRRPWHPPALRV